MSLFYLTPERCTAILTNLFDLSGTVREENRNPITVAGRKFSPDTMLEGAIGYVRAGYARVTSLTFRISEHLSSHLMTTLKQSKFVLEFNHNSELVATRPLIGRIEKYSITDGHTARLENVGLECADCDACTHRVKVLSHGLPILDRVSKIYVDMESGISCDNLEELVAACNKNKQPKDTEKGCAETPTPSTSAPVSVEKARGVSKENIERKTQATQTTDDGDQSGLERDDSIDPVESVRFLYRRWTRPTRRLRRRTAISRELTEMRKAVNELREIISEFTKVPAKLKSCVIGN